MKTEDKRRIEKTLRSNGFGQGTAKRIISLIGQALEGKGKEPVRGEAYADRPR
ncbi:hypothetical protein [Desulfovibrio sp. Huiquan2017]|uniref:hypothetical protein n=1 Tax=Desulfovibrio sp. Huiquan2017 TaxID=2816861 RepID=UPI001A91703B|nr:hypothetical protein [Desulfovibrio sp. Huiquan2017]